VHDDPLEADAALIARIAHGDRDALGPLVRRHWASMYRYLSRASREPSVAEDALQDTFLAVLEHAVTFRGEGSARAWLYTLARNALRRRYRRRMDEPGRVEGVEDVEALGAQAGFGSDFGFLAALEDREEITRALARLSDDDREVLALVDAEGLSIEEAAASLGLGEAALKSRLHRARLRFMGAMRALSVEAAQGLRPGHHGGAS
jgi:RNA polymerase sigma-70 factor (ECF subfamily)